MHDSLGCLGDIGESGDELEVLGLDFHLLDDVVGLLAGCFRQDEQQVVDDLLVGLDGILQFHEDVLHLQLLGHLGSHQLGFLLGHKRVQEREVRGLVFGRHLRETLADHLEEMLQLGFVHEAHTHPLQDQQDAHDQSQMVLVLYHRQFLLIHLQQKFIQLVPDHLLHVALHQRVEPQHVHVCHRLLSIAILILLSHVLR